jgi:hypothetical protein
MCSFFYTEILLKNFPVHSLPRDCARPGLQIRNSVLLYIFQSSRSARKNHRVLVFNPSEKIKNSWIRDEKVDYARPWFQICASVLLHIQLIYRISGKNVIIIVTYFHE